ncbi:phage tail tape measure protein [Herbaspirillum seropedicae]|uniref:phage tail tape measure protein n=1 Tax=Herbaspirillum seropedicae TaxID=964 RepID=UPI003FCD95F3
MSDLAGSVTVGLKAEKDEFKADMLDAAATVRQFQAETASAAAKSVPALNQISAAGTAGATEMSKAAERFIQSLQRQVAAVQGGKTAALELRAAQLGVSEAAAPLLATWRQLEAAQRDSAAASTAAASTIKIQAESEEQAAARIRASVAASLEKTAALNKEIEASRAAAAAAREAGGGRSVSTGGVRIDAAAQNRSLQETADLVAEVNRALGSIGRGAGSQKELQAQTDKLVSLWSQGRISAEQYATAVKQLDLSEAELNKTSAEASARADAFIARLKDQAATAGKSTKELLEYRAAQMGVSAQAAPLIAQIEAAGKSMHGFSLETSGSRRELGVLARELASGNFSGASRSFSIFAEQSGLMPSLLAPTTLAIAGLVTGIGALAVAYMQGHAEEKKFADALVVTGNAAGSTAGSLHDMAVSAAGSLGSLSSAKEAVLDLANGGKHSAEQIAMIATVAVEMQTATGRAVRETIKDFEELGRSPVDASAKLNEQYHYLTQAIYDQIAALQRQGDVQGAIDLAERTYAEAMGERARKINEHIGTIESAWLRAKNAVMSFWDTVMSQGRTDRLEQDIAEYERRLKFMEYTPQERSVVEQRVAGMKAQLAAQKELAAQQAEAAKSEDASIQASRSVDQLTESVDKNIRKRNELARLSQNFTALMREANRTGAANDRLGGVVFGEDGNPLSGGLFEKLQKDIEEKYKEKKPVSNNDNALSAQIKAIQGQIQEADRALRVSLQNNKSLYDVGLLNTQDYLKADYEARKEALDKEMELAKQQEEVAGRKKNLSSLEEAKNQQKKIRDQQLENEQKFANDTTSLLKKTERDVQAYVDSLNTAYNTRAQAIKNMVAGAGLGDAARDELNRLNQVQQEFDRAADALRKSREKGEAHGGIGQDQYDREMAALQANLEQRLQLERDYSQEIKAVQQDGWVGATRFMQNYADSAANAAAQVESVFGNAARGMEDAWANFVTTGKLDFSGLTKSVIADIAKMQARAAVSGLFNFAISAVSSYFGGGSGGESSSAATANYWQSQVGGGQGLKANALGGVYQSPSLSAYSGQVVASPTLFAFAKGAGLMGEAGPEGIFPLKRGPNGALGVQAFGAGGQIQVTTTVNVYSDGRADASTVSQTDMGKAMGDMVNQAVSARFQQELRQNGNLWKIMNGMRAA